MVSTIEAHNYYYYSFQAVVFFSNEPFGRLKSDPVIQKHFDKDWENSVRILEIFCAF